MLRVADGGDHPRPFGDRSPVPPGMDHSEGLFSPPKGSYPSRRGHYVEGGPSGDPMPLRPKGPFGGRYHRKAQCKNCTYFYRLQNGCIADYTNRA